MGTQMHASRLDYIDTTPNGLSSITRKISMGEIMVDGEFQAAEDVECEYRRNLERKPIFWN